MTLVGNPALQEGVVDELHHPADLDAVPLGQVGREPRLLERLRDRVLFSLVADAEHRA
jgi:hypothetical protein